MEKVEAVESVHSLVAIVLVCKDGLIVMKRRESELLEPGVWAGPIGHVKKGEAHEQAALRELFEETGMRASPEELKPLNESEISIADRNGRRHVLRFSRYSYRLDDSRSLADIQLSKEHTEKRVVGFEELRRCHEHPSEFEQEFSQSGAKFIHDNYFRIVSLCQDVKRTGWKSRA